MTMHLIGPQMTTTNYKKRKKKALTLAQENQLKIDWKRHNKDCRRKHMHSAQFDLYEDYRAYVRGEYKAPKKASKPLNPYQLPKVREYNIKSGWKERTNEIYWRAKAFRYCNNAQI